MNNIFENDEEIEVNQFMDAPWIFGISDDTDDEVTIEFIKDKNRDNS